MKLMLIIAVLILIIMLVWLAVFMYLSDFSVPTEDISKFKSILVVFPHADDESLTASGLMRKAADCKLLSPMLASAIMAI
jgi:hypothetical protein